MKFKKQDDLIFIESTLNWFERWRSNLYSRLYSNVWGNESRNNAWEADKNKHTHVCEEIHRRSEQFRQLQNSIIDNIAKCIIFGTSCEIDNNAEKELVLNALTTYNNLIVKVLDKDPNTPFFNSEDKLVSKPFGGSFKFDLSKCQELIDLIQKQ